MHTYNMRVCCVCACVNFFVFIFSSSSFITLIIFIRSEWCQPSIKFILGYVYDMYMRGCRSISISLSVRIWVSICLSMPMFVQICSFAIFWYNIIICDTIRLIYRLLLGKCFFFFSSFWKYIFNVICYILMLVSQSL